MDDSTARINPLLSEAAVEAADEAACSQDFLFQGVFNYEQRRDLIIRIIQAATLAALGGR